MYKNNKKNLIFYNMKISFFHIFHILLILKTPILILTLKINQIPNQKEIISIIPNNNIVYFITLSSIVKINENSNYQILSNSLKLTSQSQVIFDNISNKFISVCTKENLIETFNLNGDILSFKILNNNSITKKCTISYYSNLQKYNCAYSSYDQNSNPNILIRPFLIDNNLNDNLFYFNKDTESGNFVLKEEEKNIECFTLNQMICIYRNNNEGIVYSYYDNNNLSDSILIFPNKNKFFSVSYIEGSITMYFYNENSFFLLYAFPGNNINNFINNKYEINTIKTIDYNIIHGSEVFIENNNKKIYLLYKDKNSDDLIFEKLKLDNNIFKNEEYDIIKNDIGYSQVFLVPFLNNNNYLIITRGKSNENIIEYYFSNDINPLCQNKEINAYSYQQNLQIKISDMILRNDKENYKCQINKIYLDNYFITDDYIILNIEINQGSIQIDFSIKHKTNENLKRNCNYIINVCHEKCIKCNNINFSLSKSNCMEKMCKNNYYYDLNDYTNCIQKSNLCYEKCNTCTEIGDDNNNKCDSCIYKYDYLSKDKNCVICDRNKRFFYYDANINKNECLYNTENNKCPDNFPYLIDKSNECINFCPDNYYLVNDSKLCIFKCENYNFTLKNNYCICVNGNLDKKSDYEIYCIKFNNTENSNNTENLNNNNSLIEEIKKNSSSIDDLIDNIAENIKDLKNEEILINENDIIIHIINSSLNNEDIDKYIKKNLSYIFLGECENKLKEYYNLNKSYPLVLLITENNSNKLDLIKSIKYQIFDQEGNELNKNICYNTNIIIYYIINDTKGKIDIPLIEYLIDNNIDLFNISSEFYNDRCFSFNYKNNDITINDRIEKIYSSVSICEANCTLIEYNEELKRSKCSCPYNSNSNDIELKNRTKNIFDNINDQINYKILSCYKIFNKFFKKFFKNMGFWIFFTVFLTIIIGNIYFVLISRKKLFSEIQSFKLNNILNPPKKSNLLSSKGRKSGSSKKLNIKEEDLIILKKKQKSSSKNTNLPEIILVKQNSIKENEKKENISIYNKSSRRLETNSEISNTDGNLMGKINNKILLSNILINNNNENNNNEKINNEKINNDNINNENNNIENISYDFENNTNRIYIKYKDIFVKNELDNYWEMTFLQAIKYDRRNFFNSFINFILVKIELISTLFFPETYSSYSITIPFYILILLIDFTFNTLLYSDGIISHKYKHDGKLSFYISFLLSGISNFITFIFMKYLNKNINYSFSIENLKINYKEKDKEKYLNKSNEIYKTIIRRVKIFFIIEILISILCGYYLYIFCFLYPKTQKSLLFNYLIGLITSIVYSIIIAFLVCLFRIIAIKCEIKNLYYSSRFLGSLV